ncbi:MAG: hypothetical protein D6732_25260 [Methanobacteriota archaeon]|nr:MAG: hypothetical protein D6732_25260 [Euryarchaeota archaeon]
MSKSRHFFSTGDSRIINLKFSSGVMNLTISLNRFGDFPFRQSLMLIRPFHIVHQLAIVLLVVSLKGYFPPWYIFLKAWLMLFLLMPFLFGLNDLMHRLEDRRMGRDRLFTSESISMISVGFFLGSVFLVMALIALESGLMTFVWLLLMILCGLLYGYFKHERRTFLTYIFRMLSGVTFYLVVSMYFGFSSIDGWVSLVVGVLDLFSHVAGDLRDFPMDVAGGVRTFPVVYGVDRTERFIFGLQLLGLFLVGIIFRYGFWFWLFILVGCSLGWLTYFVLREGNAYSWQHAAFHGQKILIYVLVGVFHGVSIWFVPLYMMGWFVSYCLYLWADDRLSGSSGLLGYVLSNPLCL